MANVKKSSYSTDEKQNSFKDITSYNNFYELGIDKGDPAQNAKYLTTRPWTVAVEGEVKKPKTFDIDELDEAEPRWRSAIYRLRCVEAWSMVIPWVGFPLSALIKSSRADQQRQVHSVRHAAGSQAHARPETGIFGNVLEWPYVEGLRMDEAMHPISYSCRSVFTAKFCRRKTARRSVWSCRGSMASKASSRSSKCASSRNNRKTAWNTMQPQEYGFYSNVNPEVDHPRWSQATERRIGEFLRRKTLMFNGYGEQVASLYKGMDLKKYY